MAQFNKFTFASMNQIKINRTFLIILLGILAALGPFTIDMYLPGFIRIAEDLMTDEKHVAFTLTSYFIGIGIGQLIYGPIIDKYGRKKPLLIGLIIYIIACILCATSPHIEFMIIARFIQALGGCAGMVATNAIISDVYAKEERARAFSLLILVMGVAPLIAPSIGSILLGYSDWEFIFYFLALFSFLVLLLILFFLPETAQHTHKNRLKFSQVSGQYLDILKNNIFLKYTLISSLSMAILFAYISTSSFIFQTIYLLDQKTFSIIFAINASGLILGSSLNGVFAKKMDYLKIANFASFILLIISFIAVGTMVMYSVPVEIAVVFIFLHLFLIGFINPNATAASLEPFTVNAGAASALGGAIRMGVGALIAGLMGVLQNDSSHVLFVVMAVLSVLIFILLFLLPKSKKISLSE